jgi:hypothetical protein
MSLKELKEKSGKAFLDANAVKGGNLESCHYEPPPWVIRTDNL